MNAIAPIGQRYGEYKHLFEKNGIKAIPTNGKEPAITGMSNIRYSYSKNGFNPQAEVFDNCGIAFMTGEKGNNLIALDFDLQPKDIKKLPQEEKDKLQEYQKLVLLESKMLELANKVFGCEPPCRIGSFPNFALLVRCESISEKIPDAKAEEGMALEIIINKPFTVSGIHPDTKKPYYYNPPITPEQVLGRSISEFPIVSELQVCIVVSKFKELVSKHGYTLERPKEPVKRYYSHAGKKDDIEKLRMYLERLDPDLMEPEWFEVGSAIYRITNGTGFDLWNSWSARSKKYNRSAVRAKWNYYETHGAKCGFTTLIRLAGGAI